MNAAAEKEIERILRSEILLGTDRPLSLDATLGELGLDSLAIVNFITVIEAAYQVEIAERVLGADSPVTLRQLAALVAGTPRVVSLPSQPGVDPRTLPSQAHLIELLEPKFVGRGLLREAAWAALRTCWPLIAWAFTPTSEYLLLERLLETSPIPNIPSPPGVELRAYAPGDREALMALWPSYLRRSAGNKLDRWLRNEACALVAVEAGKIVGLAVISSTGEPGEVLVRPGKRACWGIYLREAAHARGRGIGLALLARSLADNLAQGFQVQLTSVRINNVPMLMATTQVLGFRPIGRAKRMRLLGLTHWSWQIGDNSRKGSQLVV